MKTLILLCLTLLSAAAQDHGHLNVGASGAKLVFANGADFSAPYVKTLTYTNSGKFANLYNGNITLTALHSIDPFGEIDPAAPKPGAFIVAEIVSVSGPAGGEFGFWETNSTARPAFSIPAGTTNGAFQFELSDKLLGAGAPGGDAFGHLHGRRFTATRPGFYTVGFRAFDASTNGPGGGPFHSMSELQWIHFQAGVIITGVKGSAGGTIVTIGAMAGYSWQLESTATLATPDWAPAGDPVRGSDTLVEVFDETARGGQRFYRVSGFAEEQ